MKIQNMKFKVIWLFLFGFVLSISSVSRAANIVFDFESIPAGVYINNFNSKGFRFSPDCHYHSFDSFYRPGTANKAPSGNWLSFDQSGCYESSFSSFNHDYLGPEIGQSGRMYIERISGGKFSLASFDFGTSAFDAGGMQVNSSKGGIASFTYSLDLWQTQVFDGPLWQDVDWLVFSRLGGSDTPVGFDNLVLQVQGVDEPPAVALIGASLALMGLVRRRRASIRTNAVE